MHTSSSTCPPYLQYIQMAAMCLLALTATYSMHLAIRARRRVREAVGGMSTSSCSRYPMCSDRSDLSAVQHAARKITTLMIPRALVPSQGSTDRYIACPGLLVLTQRRQRLSRARDRAVAVSTSRVMIDVSSPRSRSSRSTCVIIQ